MSAPNKKQKQGARKGSRSRPRKRLPRPAVMTLHFVERDTFFRSLSELMKVFLFQHADANEADMAKRFILVALANIEVVAPRFRSMINYCAAEGLDQTKYLESLIRVKFRKKLHRGGWHRDDGADDGDDDSSEPAPTDGTPCASMK